jgi:hypothetical protein
VTPAALTGPSTDADGSYTISWTAATGALTYQLEENLNGGSWNSVYNNTGLTTNISIRSPGTWNYRLKASNTIGSSGYSGTKTVLVAPPVPVLSVPAGTQYTGSYTISWNAVTGANTYLLQERVDSGSWSTIQNTSSTSITRTGRTTGTWGYRVLARGVTDSAYSSINTVVVSAPATPAAPTGPATDYDGTYTISWLTVTGASNYILKENKNNGSYNQVYSGSGISVNLTSRTEGLYSYKVQACSGAGCSSESGILSVDVDIPQANAVYNFGYDDNGNMTDMDNP